MHFKCKMDSFIVEMLKTLLFFWHWRGKKTWRNFF